MLNNLFFFPLESCKYYSIAKSSRKNFIRKITLLIVEIINEGGENIVFVIVFKSHDYVRVSHDHVGSREGIGRKVVEVMFFFHHVV